MFAFIWELLQAVPLKGSVHNFQINKSLSQFAICFCRGSTLLR